MQARNIAGIAAAALLLAIPSANAAQAPVKLVATKLIYPNGNPATDAVFIKAEINNRTHVCGTTMARPNSDGLIAMGLDMSGSMAYQRICYVTSPTGIGFVRWSDMSSPGETIVEPYTSVRVHFIDSTGKPLAHVKVSPFLFQLDDFYGLWTSDIPSDWNQTTNDQGCATFTKLPQGYKLGLAVDDPNYMPGTNGAGIQLATAASTPDATVQFVPGASITGTVVYGPTNTPVVGAKISAMLINTYGGPSVTTDSTGAYTFTRLHPGVYDVGVLQSDPVLKDWVPVNTTVTLSSGQHATGASVTLIHGGIITGTIIDKATGKGMPNVAVIAFSPNQGSRTVYGGVSNADGIYTIRMVPGSYDLTLFQRLPADRSEAVRHFQTTDGESQTYDFHVNAIYVVHGTVLGPDGKPVAGADVTTSDIMAKSEYIKTDAQGHFTFTAPGVTRNSEILARSGGLAMTSPFVYTGSDNITLNLTANALITLNGQITDKNGQPLPNAILTLYLWGNSRDNNAPTTTSDAQGHYTFTDAYPNATYNVDVRARGYPPTYHPNFQTGTSQTFEVPTITMYGAFAGGHP